MKRSTSTPVVALPLLCLFLSSSSLLLIIPSATALGFNCTTTTATCSALIDYVSLTNKTLGTIAQLFGVSFISLFGANSLPLSTSPVQTVEPNQTIKIPFQCNCGQGIGISNKVPVYNVKIGDYLIYIANELYSGLVTYQEIATVNDINNPNLILIGQKLWIPLPCSCDTVEGDQVVHYGHVVSNQSSVGQIAKEYGTTPGTLLKLNGLAHQNELQAGQLIDVPLRACRSMVGNDSLDYTLLVPDGTKVLTANNCVQCTCESSKNWTLHCEPSQGAKPSNWTQCPSMQCQGGLLLGDTKSPCTTCAYAGYTNQSILTTLVKTCSIVAVARKENSMDLGSKLAIAISSVAGIGIMVTLIVLYCCLSEKSSLNNKNKDIDVESFLRNNGSLVPKRYSYSDIKKITNSFKEKLGQGGYGSVFKGKLLDGRLVAVKILNESKGNGEEFINEVASISRTSHVNIVALLGYCFEGIRRALLYEFMPNGSLDKFIYDKESSTTIPRLGWETLFNIATGIGRGLEYLHRGCNTRILHFDIKPHNILLDQDFCPKIADFGLAKLCPRKDSIISMKDRRGTIGYIAPEVFFRNFGGVSHKSDVYSYGMMVLEMVGGRKNMNLAADHTSEVYFPHWIYRHFQEDQDELGLEWLTTGEEEEEIARKMSLVGLWCIQTDPSNRPSMSKVVEMLEGSITSLQIPPKPYLCSPTRLTTDCSDISQEGGQLGSSMAGQPSGHSIASHRQDVDSIKVGCSGNG
ncbi:LEAF RUST 10 DISEASE-RESISTANCE LOCUS RECEPTOR-LIKE PROTEIN KINASE-like 2.4 [Telopea speciosissima]|uniref:LEAF RUST 10 DISEASE-RESISTANCE LOCUS RECEPTOR-LIKE PROTEIN KINASE-like 2.4 n=1 Tax=Telopea speciosissima TaxID=54955 RepID=UPI001CC4F4D4|nr:LEAF RUST 10 DISEASE-RESISTANCE LOCUS RECEPTOR-LIKE PROTEIN KINASE-like 2.4 [Telopea speciosissima]